MLLYFSTWASSTVGDSLFLYTICTITSPSGLQAKQANTHATGVPCLAMVVRSMSPSSHYSVTPGLAVPLAQTACVCHSLGGDTNLTGDQQWMVKGSEVTQGRCRCAAVLWCCLDLEAGKCMYLPKPLASLGYSKAYWLTAYFSSFYLFCSKCVRSGKKVGGGENAKRDCDSSFPLP